MIRKNVWISDNLLKEIIITKEFIEANERKNGKKVKITQLEASDRIAKFLNKTRNDKNNIQKI